MCEQGTLLGGKARRSGGGGGSGGGGAMGTRESVKERSLASRRASDTSSSVTNNSTRAHLERLFHNAVNAKASDDDLTASSLQELQKLQKQVQKVHRCAPFDRDARTHRLFLLVPDHYGGFVDGSSSGR